jgi:hypothetical protein
VTKILNVDIFLFLTPKDGAAWLKRPKLLTGNGIYLSLQPSAISHLASDWCEKACFRAYLNTFKVMTRFKRIKIKKITYVVDL